jgi:ribosomal protein L9
MHIISCVLGLQDMPDRGLIRHQVVKVAPGTARNDLVPRGKAVYAHYLNRAKFAVKIAEAEEEAKATGEHEDVAATKERLRSKRILKRLRALKLVRLQA